MGDGDDQKMLQDAPQAVAARTISHPHNAASPSLVSGLLTLSLSSLLVSVLSVDLCAVPDAEKVEKERD